MKICPYCHNTGTAYYAKNDIKKDHYGWFYTGPCKCKYSYKHYHSLKRIKELNENSNEEVIEE